MPFILNAFLKMSAHCFPAGNCSIVKYTRIPAGFHSDNKKVHHSVFLLSTWFTSESNKKSHYTLLFHVRTLCHPRSKVNTIENYLDLRENEKKKFVFSTLWFLSTGKHGQKGNTGRRQGEMGKTSDVLFRKILLITAA